MERKNMSDGREEREELEKRLEEMKKQNLEDEFARDRVDHWEPERQDS
jgi:L-2-hydroxyglutarate oxidase LhgO